MSQPATVIKPTSFAFVDTWRGHRVDLSKPDPATINLDDIAWSLSSQPRFNGHTMGGCSYSVAQHSIWTAWYMQTQLHQQPTIVLQALLHDAHEAYIGDIPTPVKWLPGVCDTINPIAERLQSAIHSALKIPPPEGAAVQLISHVDHVALAVEAHYLMQSKGRNWGLPVLSASELKAWHDPRDENWGYESFIECVERLLLSKSIADVFSG